MKKFLKECALFVLPILVFCIVMEIIVGNIPNSYSFKYNYVKNYGENIQAIALGHSQLYDGFKPESFYLPSFNLCNSAQSYVDNYYILCELLPYMPNLKVVIMPIGYVNVGVIDGDSSLTDRCCYYHKYMNMDYDGRVPLKYRFECFDVSRAIDKVVHYYLKHTDIVGCDSMGRRNSHYLRNRKLALGSERIIDHDYTRIGYDYSKLCLKDESYLMQTFNMLMKKEIEIVLVSPPYYWNCSYNINMEQKKFFRNYMAQLCKDYPVRYIDLESDTTFVYDDFFNETHLSELGAEKLTRILNEKIKRNQ